MEFPTKAYGSAELEVVQFSEVLHSQYSTSST